MEQHKRMEELVKHKIDLLEKKGENQEEIEKFKSIYRLITDQYQSFFNQVSMEIVLNILQDLGVEEKEALSMYTELIKEETSKKYTLVDIDIKDEEER